VALEENGYDKPGQAVQSTLTRVDPNSLSDAFLPSLREAATTILRRRRITASLTDWGRIRLRPSAVIHAKWQRTVT
jgi:hypothetical protein